MAVAQVLQSFFRRFVAAQTATQDKFVHEIRRANGHFGEKLRAIEKQQKQFKERGIAGPGFQEHGPRAVGANERIQPRQNPVWVGERSASWERGRLARSFRRKIPSVPLWTQRKEFWHQAPGQFGRARRDVNVTRSIGEFIEQTKGFLHLLEGMLGEELFPLVLRA